MVTEPQTLQPPVGDHPPVTRPIPPHPGLRKYYLDEGVGGAVLRQAFDKSARYYDAINRAISFGTDDGYRREALARAGISSGITVLDVGCGTGIATVHAANLVGQGGTVIGLDPSIGMLREASKKGLPMLVQGTAEHLPFSSNTFDFVCMSYALRHVSDLVVAFHEYHRVLKPGGRLLLLEMTPPTALPWYVLLKLYMRHVVPAFTFLRTRSRSAHLLYRYCWDTFDQCVPPNVIVDALRLAGFTDAERHVELRIFSEYAAHKPKAEPQPAVG